MRKVLRVWFVGLGGIAGLGFRIGGFGGILKNQQTIWGKQG